MNKNKFKKLEYIWLDGHDPQNLRSKTKVVRSRDILGYLRTAREETPDVSLLDEWNFDGSSTMQAPGNNSECILKPVRTYNNDSDTVYVLCEVMNLDNSPHISNTRAELRKTIEEIEQQEFWWGFEQEYFVMDPKNNKPIGFPFAGYPEPQGSYYCGVGYKNVSKRHFTDHHLNKCLDIDIHLTGTNAEVALGQWEYQCFATDTLKACDDLWMSRYLLYKLSEEYHVKIDLHPKPIAGDWNGSGCHTNFSNNYMRYTGGKNYFINIIEKLRYNHKDHIENYGKNNNLRLTGKHETQHISKFSYGIGDRGASIRIPISVKKKDWKGYLEDRRPASNCDPYKITNCIITAMTIDSFAAEETNG